MQTIQIHIASYFDPLLLHTVRSALETADEPGRIHIAIFDQQPVPLGWLFAQMPNVKYMCVHPRHSKGACWARSMVSSLYGGQDFVLQIDAHMHFTQGWDSALLREHARVVAVSPKPILSSYPPAFEIKSNGEIHCVHPPKGQVLVHVPNVGTELKENTPAFVFGSTWRPSNKPLRGIHLAAGFLFAAGNFIAEVPYDPMVYFLGEEQSMSVRAFTHGWDIFHPTVMPIYHLYRKPGEVQANQHWASVWAASRSRSVDDFNARANARLRALLYEGAELGPFGLGKNRTLQDYSRFSGIDYPAKTINMALYQHFLKR